MGEDDDGGGGYTFFKKGMKGSKKEGKKGVSGPWGGVSSGLGSAGGGTPDGRKVGVLHRLDCRQALLVVVPVESRLVVEEDAKRNVNARSDKVSHHTGGAGVGWSWWRWW